MPLTFCAMRLSSMIMICLGYSLLAQDVAPEDMPEWQTAERLLAPLKNSGIDISSVDELLKVLQGDNLGYQSGALYLLEKRHVKSAVPIIRNLAAQTTNSPILRVLACEALAGLDRDNSSWKVPCRGLLEIDKEGLRIRAAAALAKAGDASGWRITREALTSSNSNLVAEAAISAVFFEGLELRLGEKIHLLPVCAEAFPKADEDSQIFLLSVIDKLARTEDTTLVSRLLDSAKTDFGKVSIRKMLKRIAPK